MQATPLSTALEALDQRLTAILTALQPLIAHHFLRHPWVPNAITVPLWNRIGRYARSLSRLIALFAAGRLPKPRAPHGTGQAAQRAEPAPRKPCPPIPRRHGWMLAAMGWHVAVYRNQLVTLLGQPEMAEFLAATPTAGRLLRPLCHMLGVRHASLGIDPPLFRRPPSPRRQPHPQSHTVTRPEPAPAPPPPLCPRLLTRWPWASHAGPPAPPVPGAPLRRLGGPALPLPLPV